jgi:hypothetical protein
MTLKDLKDKIMNLRGFKLALFLIIITTIEIGIVFGIFYVLRDYLPWSTNIQ